MTNYNNIVLEYDIMSQNTMVNPERDVFSNSMINMKDILIFNAEVKKDTIGVHNLQCMLIDIPDMLGMEIYARDYGFYGMLARIKKYPCGIGYYIEIMPGALEEDVPDAFKMRRVVNVSNEDGAYYLIKNLVYNLCRNGILK